MKTLSVFNPNLLKYTNILEVNVYHNYCYFMSIILCHMYIIMSIFCTIIKLCINITRFSIYKILKTIYFFILDMVNEIIIPYFQDEFMQVDQQFLLQHYVKQMLHRELKLKMKYSPINTLQ